MNVYLDNAATTKLTDEVKQYIISILNSYGNPSSTYKIGNESKLILNNARYAVAKFINCDSENIIFTSSGSASNTLGICGYMELHPNCSLYYSPICHKSIQKCCEKYNGVKLSVDETGLIDTQWMDSYLDNDKEHKLIVIDYANSEIGTIQNVKKIIDIVHKHNGICMVDCTGSISTIKVDIKKLNADIITFSAHKLGALKGVGVLYKKESISLEPLIYGAQENGLFAGTENIVGIAALGKAVELYDYDCLTSISRDYVWNYIQNNIADAYVVGSKKNRLIHNLYVCFKGISGESLMILLDMSGIQVSTGSACASGDKVISPTLLAIGMDDTVASSCIRMSFNGQETEDELDYVCQQLSKNVNILRLLSS